MFKHIIHRVCVSKHVLFFKLLLLSSAPPQTTGKILEISVAGWKCPRVSGKVALWSKHFEIRIWVRMIYLKLSNHRYMYIYIYIHI